MAPSAPTRPARSMAKRTGRPLDRDVVDHLVVGALQEGRVDGAERAEALGGEAGGEGDGVLLGDADVEAALREGLGEQVEPGAGRHGGVDRDDPVVGRRLADQLLGEHRGVAGRVRLGLVLRAGDDVELGDAVILVGGTLGRPVALALLGHDVDQHRPAVAGVADVLQHRDQVVEIVAVERADIVEAQLLEQRAAGGQAAGELLGARGHGLQPRREILGQLLGDVAKAAIGVRGDDLATGRRSSPRSAGRSTCRCR